MYANTCKIVPNPQDHTITHGTPTAINQDCNIQNKASIASSRKISPKMVTSGILSRGLISIGTLGTRFLNLHQNLKKLKS